MTERQDIPAATSGRTHRGSKSPAVIRKIRITFIVKMLIVLITITGGVSWGIYRDNRANTVEKQKTTSRPVRVSEVRALSMGPTMRFSAITKSQQHVKMSFAIGGRITRRPIKVGDIIPQGGLLAKIDPDPTINAVDAHKAQLAELDAQIDQAKRDGRRMQTLISSGAVTASSVEKVNTTIASLEASRSGAQAQLSEARRQLRESKIVSPFDSVVTAVLAEPGEMVSPGLPIVILDGSGAIEVEIEVPETLFGIVKKGQKLAVDFPLLGIKGIGGQIQSIGKSAFGPGGLFPVTVTLEEDERIHAGMTAEVLLPTGVKSGMSVPVSAVINPTGTNASVLKVVDGTTVKVPILTHNIVADRVLIEGDLSEGEWVITEGHQQLLNGSVVIVAR